MASLSADFQQQRATYPTPRAVFVSHVAFWQRMIPPMATIASPGFA